MSTPLIAGQNVEAGSSKGASIYFGVKESVSFVSVYFPHIILLDEFAFVAEGNIASASIDGRVGREDGLHVPSCACLGTSLEGLGERVLFVGLGEHFSLIIAEYFSWVDAPKGEVWVSVDVGEKVFPPPGVLEGAS